MRERGVWHRVKEGAFWVAEKSTFITVPLGLFFIGKALLAKEFLQAGVLGAFVGVDVLMYKYFKNRREQQRGGLSTESGSFFKEPISLAEYKERKGTQRLEHEDRLALVVIP